MLKNLILTLLLSLSAISPTFAQKLYFDTLSRPCDQAVARSYATVTKKGNVYDVIQYDMKGEKTMTGSYTSVDDGLKRNRHGMFAYYNSNGKVWTEGMYKNNLAQGTWKTYSFGGKLKAERMYKDDSLEGPYTQYSILTGEKKLEANYINGKVDGTAKRYIDGKLAEEIKYTAGKLESRTVYNEQGHITKQIKYGSGGIKSAHAYDDHGQEESYTPTDDDKTFSINNYIVQLPRATYNYMQFLSDNIHYPKKARKAGIEGRVLVRFIVSETGDIKGVEIVKSVDPDIDAEAVRVVSRFAPWTPGMQDGEPVNVYFTLPIQFQLED